MVPAGTRGSGASIRKVSPVHLESAPPSDEGRCVLLKREGAAVSLRRTTFCGGQACTGPVPDTVRPNAIGTGAVWWSHTHTAACVQLTHAHAHTATLTRNGTHVQMRTCIHQVRACWREAEEGRMTEASGSAWSPNAIVEPVTPAGLRLIR